MKLYRVFITILAGAMLLSASSCSVQQGKKNLEEGSSQVEVASTANPDPSAPTVYFTSSITPEGLVKVYEALGVKANGRVAVKISTGESSESIGLGSRKYNIVNIDK